MALAEVDPRTLRELRRFLRDASTAERKETRRLTDLHKGLARDLESKARAKARSMGGVQKKAADAIVGRGTQGYASLALRGGRRWEFAPPAFWGALQRTGWNAGNVNSRPQHPEWIGTSWDVAVRGEGPYAINDTLAAERDRIVDRYGDLIDALARDVGFT